MCKKVLLTYDFCNAEKPPASPKHKGTKDRVDAPLKAASPTEESREKSLHDLNDKLLKEVASLRTKVAKLEGDRTTVR
jgi:hypothetical protein